ncbi:methyltransferase domain-containing protein [Undibacterium fentianense]|uniref:Class I SAM-dependent methyltransferase n=1 Tax=Undibacterium fentianense TaxID=2828728 RepID=A0A941IEW5_9BURK|nr:class I SAM-dependent methyltransferase [Undibacterium fentianense]MBR7801558.1 class I SAM-dependent methyltransferase [Undibacterium fentianense]
MHPSALQNCQLFFDHYHSGFSPDAQVMEIGSQDVNGSLRPIFSPTFSYTGVDFVAAKGVDVVLDDPYQLPFADASMDVIVSSSCFEHSEMFWLVFLEVMRVLKPHGLFYLNVPSNGAFHQYPVDCWRFYPDSGKALVTWAKRNGIPAALLESYVSEQGTGQWNDFVAVFLKDEAHVTRYPSRITQHVETYRNAYRFESNEIQKLAVLPEDMRKLVLIHKVIAGKVALK